MDEAMRDQIATTLDPFVRKVPEGQDLGEKVQMMVSWAQLKAVADLYADLGFVKLDVALTAVPKPTLSPPEAEKAWRTPEAALAEALGLKELPPPETDMLDQGDSLDLVETLFALEDEFYVSFSDADAERCKTVGATLAILKEKIDARQA